MWGLNCYGLRICEWRDRDEESRRVGVYRFYRDANP